MKHTVIRSKMKKGKPLMKDPIVSRYVPEMNWLDSSSLKRMIKTYSTVYIKPDKGRQGKGVIRVKKLNNSKSEISYKQKTKRVSSKKVMKEIKKNIHLRKKYLIQQGIKLATYHRRPFDVRLVLQKPLNRWRLTLMTAKVAPRRNSIVTNVSKGAKDVNVVKVLHGVDQPLNVLEVLRELIDVSHQIVQVLDSHFPLQIVGLDMGIDKKGKVWFIEANTKPDCTGLRKLDRKLYRKYLEAKKLIGKGNRMSIKKTPR
jgi:hypothetical protein